MTSEEQDGLLLIDKGPGLSSFDVLRCLRRHFGVRKAGHAGTLDPTATGLLLVLVGKATRLVPYLMGTAKTYHATVCLGTTTTTDDSEGEILSHRPCPDFSDDHIEQALRTFIGPQRQVPPIYSAIHVDGKRAYALARAGQNPELPPRDIVIHRIENFERQGPQLSFVINCSKGTYIRSVARDLGEKLGCGAHLAALRRLAVGPFNLQEAFTLDPLPPSILPHYLTPFQALAAWPLLEVSPARLHEIHQGKSRRLDAPPGVYRIPNPRQPDALSALAEIRNQEKNKFIWFEPPHGAILG